MVNILIEKGAEVNLLLSELLRARQAKELILLIHGPDQKRVIIL